MDSTQRTKPRTGGSPVGLVVFIILTAAFAVLAYWAFAKYQSAAEDLKKTKASLTAADQQRTKVGEVNAAFQKVTGVDTPDSLKGFIKNVLDATKAEGYGQGAQDNAKDALNTALNAVTQLKQALDSLNKNYAAEVAAHNSLKEAKEASDATYKKELDDRAAEIQDLEKKMADEKSALEARIYEEISQREADRETYYTMQDEWTAREAKYLVHVVELQQRLREVSGEGAVLEKESGEVTQVDIRNQLATMNIGSSSGVKAGMRFVAFTKDTAGNPVKKGVIEIVRVEDKVSVGRIVSVEADMAVGKGDYVYNLAGPTKKLFVFAGTPQLYTIDQWRNIIRANGGDIAEQVRTGDQLADYLIVGQFDEQQDRKAVQMIYDARDFGLKIMKEEALKSAMGL